jgi:hypothetical protein
MPLLIGEDDGGEAYFGVVVGFSPLPALPAPIVLVLDVLCVLGGCEALELLDELLLDDPQPASARSARATIDVEMTLLIGAPTLA